MTKTEIEAMMQDIREGEIYLADQRARVAQSMGRDTPEAKLARAVLAALEQSQAIMETRLSVVRMRAKPDTPE